MKIENLKKNKVTVFLLITALVLFSIFIIKISSSPRLDSDYGGIYNDAVHETEHTTTETPNIQTTLNQEERDAIFEKLKSKRTK